MMSYKEYEKDEFVIEHGEKGEDFYLILDGCCEVLVPNKKDEAYRNVSYQARFYQDMVE